MNEGKIKTTSKKNAKLIILITLTILLLVLIPIGYALFSDKSTKIGGTEIGEIEVILEEDWPEREEIDPTTGKKYDEFGLEKYSKKINGKSIGNLPAYVRIRCIPIVEYNTDRENGEGDWVTAPVAQNSIRVYVNTVDQDDNTQEEAWVQSGDYWYYKHIVQPGEKTKKMSIDWQINELPSELEGYKVRSDVRIILEYAQTTHDLWKDIFQIVELPEGVE